MVLENMNLELLRDIIQNLRESRIQQRNQLENQLDRLDNLVDRGVIDANLASLERARIITELEQSKVVNEVLQELINAIRDSLTT